MYPEYVSVENVIFVKVVTLSASTAPFTERRFAIVNSNNV